MVAPKSNRSKAKHMREREDLVRRSPVLSDAAKVLWIELCRGWAWDDENANVSQPTLAESLGWSPRKVQRVAKELKKHDLVIVTQRVWRTPNEYRIVDTIPEAVCAKDRLINKIISKQAFEARSTEAGVPNMVPLAGATNLVSQADPEESGVPNLVSQGRQIASTRGTKFGNLGATKVVPKDEIKEDELKEDELLKMRTSENSLDFLFEPELDEEDHQKIAALTYDPDTDEEDYNASYVREEPEAVTMRRKREKLKADILAEKTRKHVRQFTKRSSDPNLVGKGSSGVLAEASSKATDEYLCVYATPPPVSPPKTPEDVLQLLHDEIVGKYGSTMALGVPMGVTKQDIGQLKNCILTKYRPDAVLAMVRVLVWDWEVARSSIFPKKEQQRLPALGDLVRYRDALAGAIATGLIRTGNYLGERKSYSAKYVDPNVKLHDDDPF